MTQAVLGALTAEDFSTITQVTQRFVDAILAGDFASAAQLYTPDATLMPPHQPAVGGRAAIQTWMASLPKVTRFTFEIDAIDGRADLAYVRGRYSSTIQTPHSEVENTGKFLEIRRRQPDRAWLIDVDMFNSDLP